MNFQKYEQEMNNFLNENYQNLKRAKISNSEFALKELLQTEQADINNYSVGFVRRIISDARKSFVEASDTEKGYELGETYRTLVMAPTFNQIEVNFTKEIPETTHQNLDTSHPAFTQRQATQNVVQRIEADKQRARNLAIGAGAATAAIGIPTGLLLTPASFGTSLLVVGLSAVVVAGMVYTVISYVDDNGKKNSYVASAPSQASITTVKPSAKTKKKTNDTIDQASMTQLLDTRKAEAQKELLKTIQEAKQQYELLQAQIQIV